MNDLQRELAPISDTAWEEIEDEAKRTLKLMLAARKLVDFAGPLGWEASAVSLGRTRPAEGNLGEGVQGRIRRIQPFIELRVAFELSRDELETVGRGAKDPDLDPVREAARRAAIAEDRIVFGGLADAGLQGIGTAAAETAVPIPEAYESYPAAVAEAVSRLRTNGIIGPYGIALGPRCYTGLTRTTVGGYPVIDHVRRLLDGPIVWAPAISGAVVLSLRGGDFELTVGQDFSIGYLAHSATTVRLYLQESFTFRVLSPEAAVPLVYPAAEN
jgi:uncharacterized linocin/CFP29 family protein